MSSDRRRWIGLLGDEHAGCFIGHDENCWISEEDQRLRSGNGFTKVQSHMAKAL